MSDLQEGKLNATPVSVTKHFAPISSGQRLVAMDIIRGLALVGILLMNIEWFNRAIASLGSQDTSLTGLDHAVAWLIRCFVEGKFYTLFALLFGMGFAVMLLRAKEAGRPFGVWVSRRMIILIIFGMLHMIFFWGGDILHSYGFAGLLLLAWVTLLKQERFQRYDNPKSFFKLALVWLFVPIFISVLNGIGFGLSHDTQDLTAQWHKQIQVAERVKAINLAHEKRSETRAEKTALTAVNETIETANVTDESFELVEQELIERQAQAIVTQQQAIKIDELAEIRAFTQKSYWQATKFRLNFALYMLMLTVPFSFMMLMPLFILGYWLVSSGIMKNYQQHVGIFKVMAWISMSLGTVLEVAGLLVAQHPVANQVTLLQAVGETIFYIGQLVMTAGYFSLIMYLLADEKWHMRLTVFSPMGRMALTNYIMQSVILSSIFYGYAGGYFGEISRAPQMLLVFAIVVFQLLFSRWWLNNYAFGPLEWLWRCLSYKKLQSMRI